MRKRTPALLFCLFTCAAALRTQAEVIDCIAVTLGSGVITLSEIFADIRMTEFLNGEPLKIDEDDRKRAEERLIQQTLLRREMDLNHYPAPKPQEADPLWTQLRARFQSDAEFQEALEKYGVTEQQVRDHLLQEVAAVHFIDYRFRSSMDVPDADIADYYQKRVEEWKAKGVNPIPTLEQSRADIEAILQKERANHALDLWMADVRTQMDISYRRDACR
ncbi:MAG TPA: hypothetical protein VHD76_17515 [Bryobacteraceae bacterium]|jgi:hypothetical protein|nr:hypothetical protein [Bryobacteraceae bacterium]